MNKNAIWFRVHVILYFKRLSVVGKKSIGDGVYICWNTIYMNNRVFGDRERENRMEMYEISG